TTLGQTCLRAGTARGRDIVQECLQYRHGIRDRYEPRNEGKQRCQGAVAEREEASRIGHGAHQQIAPVARLLLSLFPPLFDRGVMLACAEQLGLGMTFLACEFLSACHRSLSCPRSCETSCWRSWRRCRKPCRSLVRASW